MDIVFRHLYCAPLPFLPVGHDGVTELRNKASFENFFLALDVLEAADKYLLPDLGHAADLALVNFVRFSKVDRLVEIAPVLHGRSQPQTANLFALTIIKLSNSFVELVRQEKAWYALHSHAELQKMVLDYHVGNYSEESVAKFFEARTGRPWTDIQTPTQRSTWYTSRWGDELQPI